MRILIVMTKVESLEREVEQLAPEELPAFRAWFIERDWQAWDRELEQDVAAGRLDHLADEALAEYERARPRNFESPRGRRFLG